MQLKTQFHDIFTTAKIKCWLRPYEILSIGPDSGIIECISDAVSIDSAKKATSLTSLSDYFRWNFGPPNSRLYRKACVEFVRSLAGYSLFCFLLQVKDRHNGNILIDSKGRMIHIDFGFLLSNSPGKGINFEQAPFKLTDDFVTLMGGVRSRMFKEFR
jgi:phosphatidylinositol 4-kinase